MTRLGMSLRTRRTRAGAVLALGMVIATVATLWLASSAGALVVYGGASGELGLVPSLVTPPPPPVPVPPAAQEPPLPPYPVVIPAAPVTSPVCTDTAGVFLPTAAMCYNGGPVLHTNVVYGLYWDPQRLYFSTTKLFVDQFMQDVGTGSGSLSTPFALTTQYPDSTGRPEYNTVFRGPYNDSTTPYPPVVPANDPAGCTPEGIDMWGAPDGIAEQSNSFCITDQQAQQEIVREINANDLPFGSNQIFALFLPPGVEVCTDATNKVCSVAQFCSYHSYFDYDGSEVPYIVQPFTAGESTPSLETVYGQATATCDETGLPPLITGTTFNPVALAQGLGARLVSPLSASWIDAVVNPFFTGWFSTTGHELSDGGQTAYAPACQPLGVSLDTVPVGPTSYVIQREFNNGGVLTTDLNSPDCAPNVNLQSQFVAPDPVHVGDVIQLDGTTSVATMDVQNYQWNFGDGTTSTLPSVVHTYNAAGNYTVTLTVTDRGGNVASSTETITVVGPGSGAVITGPGSPGAGGSGGAGSQAAFSANVQLISSSVKSLIKQGIPIVLNTNRPGAGFVTILLSRASAKAAHINAGSLAAVGIGTGILSGVVQGSTHLRLHLGKSVAARLSHLSKLTLTLRVQLTDAAGTRETIDVAHSY